MAVVSRGQYVIGVVSQSVALLQGGDQSQAAEKLKQLKTETQQLSKEAQELSAELHVVQEQYKCAVEEATKSLSALTNEKYQQERKLNMARHDLRNKQSQLSDLQSQLDVARRNLSVAQKEKAAAKGGKDAMIGTTIGVGVAGVLFSVATLGIGTPVAVAATTACGLTAAKYAEEEDEAKRNISSYEQSIGSVNRSISTCQTNIQSYESEIRRLGLKVQQQEEVCRTKQAEKEDIQSAIAFLQEAQYYWNRLSDALQDRTEQTHRLHCLLEKAEERKDRQFLRKRGSQTKVMSFVQAWEHLREEMSSGSKYLINN